jgi:hypothetical protein
MTTIDPVTATMRLTNTSTSGGDDAVGYDAARSRFAQSLGALAGQRDVRAIALAHHREDVKRIQQTAGFCCA